MPPVFCAFIRISVIPRSICSRSSYFQFQARVCRVFLSAQVRVQKFLRASLLSVRIQTCLPASVFRLRFLCSCRDISSFLFLREDLTELHFQRGYLQKARSFQGQILQSYFCVPHLRCPRSHPDCCRSRCCRCPYRKGFCPDILQRNCAIFQCLLRNS